MPSVARLDTAIRPVEEKVVVPPMALVVLVGDVAKAGVMATGMSRKR